MMPWVWIPATSGGFNYDGWNPYVDSGRDLYQKLRIRLGNDQNQYLPDEEAFILEADTIKPWMNTQGGTVIY